MTLVIIIASIITGTVVGCWLTLVIATAAMSRSQEHMEKKVRYWQERARLARVAEEHERLHAGLLARGLNAPHGLAAPSLRPIQAVIRADGPHAARTPGSAVSWQRSAPAGPRPGDGLGRGPRAVAVAGASIGADTVRRGRSWRIDSSRSGAWSTCRVVCLIW